MSDWREEVKVEQLPEKIRDIADVIGAANAIRLSEMFGGLPLYIPKSGTVNIAIRNNRIREEFTGDNQRALALKYKLSLRMIQVIVNGK